MGHSGEILQRRDASRHFTGQADQDGDNNRFSINRRPTQIYADSIFSLLDLSKEKLHALRATVLFFL
jgi:hypothetical protein